MTTHYLLVTADPDEPQERDWFTYQVECPGVSDECRLWQDCHDPADDPDALDALEDEGDDEPVVHGVRHRKVAGGWMVPTDRCYVQGHDAIPEEAAGRFGPGRHPIGWDVGDGTELEIQALENASRP